MLLGHFWGDDMYLSRVEIDSENRLIMRKLTHLGAYHNWVEQAFPKEIKEGERSRKLWRIDTIAGKRYLLLLSERRPEGEQLETYAVKGSFSCKEYTPFLRSIQKGESFRFRVTLNPVHSVFREGMKRGKIYPLYGEVEQRKFLLERMGKYGFHVEDRDFLIVEKGEEILRKKGKIEAKIVKAVYEGRLTVDDTAAFIALLCNGMGREKAYGFGMMTVIRG